MAIKAGKLPDKAEEFNKYVVWKSIPALLRGLSAEQLEKQFGIEDEEIHELAKITRQKYFAKAFKVDETTLVKWNKLIENEKLIDTSRVKFANKLVSNVLLALYRTAVKQGKAAEVGMFLEYAGVYVPKTEVIKNNGEQEEETLDEIEKAIKTKEARAEAIKRRIREIATRAGSHRARTKGAGNKKAAARKEDAAGEPQEADI